METQDQHKGYLKKILALGFGCLFAFLLAEVSLRMILPIVDKKPVSEFSPGVIPDPLLGRRLAPDSPGHDHNGFNNIGEVRERYPIVALGDSHTYAVPSFSDEGNTSWPFQLQKISNIPVYNMGVWGYGPAQYYALTDEALSYKPKLLIVGMFMGNDVFDSYDMVYNLEGWKDRRHEDFVNSSPSNVLASKQIDVPLRGLRDTLREYSKLYYFLGDRTRIIREKLGISKPRMIGTLDWSSVDHDVPLRYDQRAEIETLFWNGHRVAGVDMEDKNVIEGMKLTKEFLSEINTKANKSGAKLVLVMLPIKASVYEPAVRYANLTNPVYEKIIKDESKIRKELFQLCETENFVCIDLLPKMRDKIMNGVALYPTNWDDHPSPAGYRIYAELIREELETKKIFPKHE